MKPESLKNIKAELQNIPAKEVLEICLRLAKFKQENKELLTYLLFQQYDKHLFISNVKEHMKSEFKFMNDSSFYLAKKTLRKLLRTTNKYIKFAADKQVEVELRIYYLQCLKNSNVEISWHQPIYNLYHKQLALTIKAIISLHEDLRHDYQLEINDLEI